MLNRLADQGPRRTGQTTAIQDEILTIPAHRPIKQVYIADLVRFIERVIEAGE